MTHDTTTKKPRKQTDRPFPWTCANCLKAEVYPQTISYAADIKHDGRLYHLEIPQLKIPICKACGERVFSNSVDEQIIQALRARVRLLTPQQIKDGRTALGLKKTVLAERLGVAAATLSRWETGAMIQSRAMDNFLRVYFAVPEMRAVLRGGEQDPNLGTFLKTLQKPSKQSSSFHLLPEEEAAARDRAARFGLLRPPCPPSESAGDAAAPQTHSPVSAVEHLSNP